MHRIPVRADEPIPEADRPVRISEITGDHVKWILPGWIPAGKISIIFGDPGLGKSLVTLDLAARLTSGRPMPLHESASPFPFREGGRGVRQDEDDKGNQEVRQPSNVLLFSAEDAVADTIKPRLEAAGADCSRVHVFPDGGHSIFADCNLLDTLIREFGAALVVVDPLAAYAGRQDIYRDQHVRRLLTPIAAIAASTGAAFLFVHHPNKRAAGKALMRSSGSIGIAAAARSMMMIGKDPVNPSRHVLVHVKGNLGAPPLPMRFHIVQEDGAQHPHIQWAGLVEDVTADNLLRNQPAGGQPSAEMFLRNALSSGPMLSRDLEALARAQGIAGRTLDRAKQAITHSTRVGGLGPHGGWQTRLNNSETTHLPK